MKMNFSNMRLSSNGEANAVFNLTPLLSTEVIILNDSAQPPPTSPLRNLNLSMCSQSGRKMCTSAALDEKNVVKQVVVVAAAGAVLTVTSCFKGQHCK